MKSGRLTIDGNRFRDAAGRHVILRGVNLGGDSKVPTSPNGHTCRPTDFADHRTVSFVGRPFPLEEADTHLARIAGWGFNCLRLLTTWEAVEHAGPNLYDEAYLDYFAAVCAKAGAHGLYVFIDFHQDAWSRMSGGDGAPGWTFEAVGLNFTRFHAADAAHVMQYRYDPGVGGQQDSYPQMSWATNYRMPANSIMWTLFFAGEAFAPAFKVDGLNVGRWLRDRYLGAVKAVAERVADMDHVIGFDTLNEPGSGWIGRDLDDSGRTVSGLAWTPLDGLAVASGLPRTLPFHAFRKGVTEHRVVNPDGISIWLPGREDPFKVAGVWADGPQGPTGLKPDHFRVHEGRQVTAEGDFMASFFCEVAAAVRSVRDDWLIFAEVDPFAALSGLNGFPEGMPERTVNASHWYDLAALVTKRFDPGRSGDGLTDQAPGGRQAIEETYVTQLTRLKTIGDAMPGQAPTLIGEFGIPFDLNKRQAYQRWADGDRSDEIWSDHVAALRQMYNAMDRLLLSATQWNYTASNANDPAIGDGWNQEDLSIWSQDQLGGSTDGARAIEGFRRPYVRHTQGDLISQAYDAAAKTFDFEIRVDPQISEPTQIYLPAAVFGTDATIALSGDGEVTWRRAGDVMSVTVVLSLAQNQAVGLKGQIAGSLTGA